jgi:hypothetical protein
MSETMMDVFLAGIGKPDLAVPPGLQFTSEVDQMLWDRAHAQIGAGWYRNRFLFLFGEGLEALRPCVEAWSFLLPRRADPVIVGRNAYGAIAIIEDAFDVDQKVGVLDPLHIRYYTDGDALRFGSLIGSYLPRNELPGFLDTSVYEKWLAQTHLYLELDVCLAIKKPLSLDGAMEVDNFQVEGIVEYYQTTAPIYEGRSRRTRRRPDRAGRHVRRKRPPGSWRPRRRATPSAVWPSWTPAPTSTSPARAARPRSWSPRRRVTWTWCALWERGIQRSTFRTRRTTPPCSWPCASAGRRWWTRSSISAPRSRRSSRHGHARPTLPSSGASPPPCSRSGARTFRR